RPAMLQQNAATTSSRTERVWAWTGTRRGIRRRTRCWIAASRGVVQCESGGWRNGARWCVARCEGRKRCRGREPRWRGECGETKRREPPRGGRRARVEETGDVTG